MVSILEYILGYVLLWDNVQGIWDGVSPYLPPAIKDNIILVGLFLSSKYIIPFIIVYIIIIFWKMKLSESQIRMDYRFSDTRAKLLKLPYNRLNESEIGEVTNIFIIGGIKSNFCRKILSIMNFKLLFIFESTCGINLNVERQYTGFEITENPHLLIISSDVSLSGTNMIEIGITKEDMSPLYDDGEINMKVCVGPVTKRFINILQVFNGILCENKIDIG